MDLALFSINWLITCKARLGTACAALVPRPAAAVEPRMLDFKRGPPVFASSRWPSPKPPVSLCAIASRRHVIHTCPDTPLAPSYGLYWAILFSLCFTPFGGMPSFTPPFDLPTRRAFNGRPWMAIAAGFSCSKSASSTSGVADRAPLRRDRMDQTDPSALSGGGHGGDGGVRTFWMVRLGD